jgi:hypothetical protein
MVSTGSFWFGRERKSDFGELAVRLEVSVGIGNDLFSIGFRVEAGIRKAAGVPVAARAPPGAVFLAPDKVQFRAHISLMYW